VCAEPADHFCILTDDCRGASVVRQVNATVDDAIVTLTDLQPHQVYHVSVRSVSATNSKSEPVRLTLKTGRGGLSAGLVAAVVIAACVMALLTVAAISFLIRYLLTCSTVAIHVCFNSCFLD